MPHPPRRLVPAADRDALRTSAQQMVRVAREAVIEKICEPEVQSLLWEAIKSRLYIGAKCPECGQEGRAPRDGPRLLAEIMGLVDAAPQLQLAITNYLNVSPEEAKLRVDMAGEVSEMDDEARFELCLDYVLEAAEKDDTMARVLRERVAKSVNLLPDTGD